MSTPVEATTTTTGVAEGDLLTSARVWRHPHVRDAAVLEDAEGRLYLLFEQEGAQAWARRRPWRGGVRMLLPDADPADFLARFVQPSA